MSSAEPRSTVTEIPAGGIIDMKLEVVVISQSDVDRSKDFYAKLGWRLDADRTTADGLRVVHFTPPGSQCSILFGTGVTRTEPGSTQGLHLIVSDIEAARDELVAHGVDASEVFHDAGGGFNRFDGDARASGPDPKQRSYASFASFSDPDGNGWLLQEVTTRLPGGFPQLHFARSLEDAARDRVAESARFQERRERVAALSRIVFRDHPERAMRVVLDALPDQTRFDQMLAPVFAQGGRQHGPVRPLRQQYQPPRSRIYVGLRRSPTLPQSPQFAYRL